MGRPWLNANDFNTKFSNVTDALNKQIEKELSARIDYFGKDKYLYSNKSSKLKSYRYENIIMDNYGIKIFDKNNNLIGYKFNDFEYVKVNTYYNDNHLLCNKIEIREFDTKDLSFRDEIINSWIDVKTDFGFIREFFKRNLLLR